MKKTFLIAAVVVSATCMAQKVPTKLTFQKGQKLEMVAQVNSVVTQDMMGQSMEAKVNATITRTFDVEDVTGGKATIEHKVKRIQWDMEAPMVGEKKFDSENEEDLKTEEGKAMEKSLKNKYTMTVDATGKVTAVKLDDDNPNKKAGSENGGTDNMMGQLTAGLEPPKEGDVIDLKILPDRELKKGESWTDSVKNKKTVYTVSDMTDADIVLDFTENGTTERKQEAMGMEMTLTSKDKTTGRILVDRKTGLLKEKTATTDSEGLMEVMGQSVPMTTKVKHTVTVKGF